MVVERRSDATLQLGAVAAGAAGRREHLGARLDVCRAPPTGVSVAGLLGPALDERHHGLDLLPLSGPPTSSLQAGIGELTLPETTTPP